MRNIAIVRKVPFKLANRLVWGIIVSQSQGLSLILLKKTSQQQDHALVVAEENVDGRFFEDAKTNRFYLGHQDLAEIGDILGAMGSGLSREELDRFFDSESDDEKWKE